MARTTSAAAGTRRSHAGARHTAVSSTWRKKFDRIFVEEIKHPIDEDHFDVFRVVRVLTEPKFEIPFDVTATFTGSVEDLNEHDHELWSRPTEVSVP